MTPQVLVRYLERYVSIFNDSSSIGQIPRIHIFNESSSIRQIPRNVYSMTPQVLVGYLGIVYSMNSSSIGHIPRKVYTIAPQVLVRYLEKYIQWLLK